MKDLCNNIYFISKNIDEVNNLLIESVTNKLNSDLLVNKRDEDFIYIVRVYGKGEALENIPKDKDKYKHYKKMKNNTYKELIDSIILLNTRLGRDKVYISDTIKNEFKVPH